MAASGPRPGVAPVTSDADDLRNFCSFIPLSYEGVRARIPVTPRIHGGRSHLHTSPDGEHALHHASASSSTEEAAPTLEIEKMVIREGWSARMPVEGCPTRVHYLGRMENGDIFSTTLDRFGEKFIGGTDKPATLSLLRRYDETQGAFDRDDPNALVPEGLHLAVATMCAGEIARFWVPSAVGYGASGDGLHVPPHATLIYDVLLCSWDEALPPLPTREEVARAEEEGAREERAWLIGSERPTVFWRIHEAGKHKDEGNHALKQADVTAAKKAYDTGFVHVYVSKDEWEVLLDDNAQDAELLAAVPHSILAQAGYTGETTESSPSLSRDARAAAIQYLLASAKLPLCLNRSLASLKLGKLDDALWDANQALSMIPESYESAMRADDASEPAADKTWILVDFPAFHAKALYRRACVHAARVDRAFAKEAAREFWDQEKTETSLTQATDDALQSLEVLRTAGRPADAGVTSFIAELREKGRRLRQLVAAAEQERDDKLRKIFSRALQAAAIEGTAVIPAEGPSSDKDGDDDELPPLV